MCQNVNSPGGQLSPLEERHEFASYNAVAIIACRVEREGKIMKWDGIHGMYMELCFNFMCV